MSVAYASTSFGSSSPTPSSSRNQTGSARHQRQSSGSSGSSAASVGAPIMADEIPGLPQPVTARSPTQSLASDRTMRTQYDQIGAFFGAQPGPQPSQPSEHDDSELGHTHNGSAGRIPPAYDSRSEIESLPTYSKIEEYDAALNRKLFIYGFLFFPLWIVGIIAPFVKPSHDPAKDNRTKEDQEADYASMRAIEIRWAWRCGAALLAFIALVVVAAVVGVTVASHH